ncbi:MAG: aspartate/glutamate racemase family protein [Erysipelotrichaceae bacterium]
MKIAVYDSGLGGLWVLYSLINNYPNHEYLYLGDQKNAPYGSKNKEGLLRIIENNFIWLKKQGVDKIVVACNTACSIGALSIEVDGVDIEGIIDKTTQQINTTSYQRILVLATPLTISNGVYQKNLKTQNNEVVGLALDELVEMLENQVDYTLIQNYLSKVFSTLDFEPDAIVLGCTHYPFVQKMIESFYHVPIFNSNHLSFEFSKDTMSKLSIYTSKDVKKFELEIKNLFGREEKVFLKE